MENQNKIYTCPMHPEINQEMPGMCSECGMALLSKISKIKSQKSECHNHHNNKNHNKPSLAKATEDKHAGHSTRMFLKKFWVCLALTILVVLYSDMVMEVLGFVPPKFTGSGYVPFILGSVVFFYGGWVFIASAGRELKARLPGMMTLIALAVSAAYLYSIYSILMDLAFAKASAGQHDLFWELTTLITIMLLGHWLEMKAVSGAQGALKELSKLLPDTAEAVVGTTSDVQQSATKTVPLSALKITDVVLVRPGGRIPADGIVVEGWSDVNESMVTGESSPVSKTLNSEVIAGTINGDGSLKIKVTKIGEQTFLAGVMRLVAEAQASKSKLQILSDRAAFYLTLIAIGAGGLTFALWLVARAGVSFALERLVAVLVIACPHALGLAVPLVASISTTLAARNGFLVRQRLALELARKIDVVLFDKTGTLTKGEYGVTNIITNSQLQITDNEVIKLAASVDSHSEHFVARALVAEAQKKGLALEEIKNFQRLAGRGARGELGGQTVFVGGEAILDEASAIVPEEFRTRVQKLAEEGQTIIYVVVGKDLVGAVALADVIRAESRPAIQDLKNMGIKVAMITGDSEGVAKWVANDLGLTEYFARVLPGQKSEKVKLLQSHGNKVAMVGDGINDAPALVQADLGIAIGAGTNVAIESAGIILMRNDPRDIVKIIKLSRATYSKMVQNLIWATGYNVIALPLAAGALAFKGITLQPAVAGLLMSVSTIVVAFNAMILKNKKL